MTKKIKEGDLWFNPDSGLTKVFKDGQWINHHTPQSYGSIIRQQLEALEIVKSRGVTMPEVDAAIKRAREAGF
jgi:hypothetical protein